MIKTVIKHGNSRAILIEKPILDLLQIDDDTLLEITTDGEKLIVTPLGRAQHQARVREGIDQAHRQYRKALRRLAK